MFEGLRWSSGKHAKHAKRRKKTSFMDLIRGKKYDYYQSDEHALYLMYDLLITAVENNDWNAVDEIEELAELFSKGFRKELKSMMHDYFINTMKSNDEDEEQPGLDIPDVEEEEHAV